MCNPEQHQHFPCLHIGIFEEAPSPFWVQTCGVALAVLRFFALNFEGLGFQG